MRIEKVRIQNYRCFEDMEIEFHHRMNVLVGNNGVGKSSILDAVSVAVGSIFLGIESSSSPAIKNRDIRYLSRKIGSTVDRQPQLPVSVTSWGEADGRNIRWSRQLNTQTGRTTQSDAAEIKKIASRWQSEVRQGNHSIVLPLIAYYGTSRLWPRKQESSIKHFDNRLQGYIDCLLAESNEKLMLKWFEKMTYTQLQEGEIIPELQAVKNAVSECFIESGAEVREVSVMFNVKTYQLEISYIDRNNKYHCHPFHELSDGYRNTLSLIADIAYRMAVLNPQFLGDVTKKTSGIVMIDEIDLHLHPIWQKRILKTLKEVFPLIQFIVTTHSPSIISSAKAEELIILDGNTCRTFDYEVYGKDANSVLSEIMETSERPDEITDMFREFEDHLDNGDYKKAEKILNKLREVLGGNDNGVVSAAVSLDFEKDWEE